MVLGDTVRLPLMILGSIGVFYRGFGIHRRCLNTGSPSGVEPNQPWCTKGARCAAEGTDWPKMRERPVGAE
jgi:hypothetical protein